MGSDGPFNLAFHGLVDGGHGRTPRWLAEGLAIHLAGEGRMVAKYEPRKKTSTEEIENQLADGKSNQSTMRAAYAAAYREVKRLLDSEGEGNVWRRVAQ